MTLRPVDNWFLQKDEPLKSCLQFLREYILKQNPGITESWKYGMPFFVTKEKCFVTSGYTKSMASPI